MKLLAAATAALACACGPTAPPATPAPATAPAADAAAEPAGPDVAALYRAWVDRANAGDWDAVGASFAEDATIAPASSGMELRGRDNILVFLQSFNQGFPDLKTWPLTVLTHGKQVAAVALTRGTHSADMGAMKATGKTTSFVGLTTIGFDDAGAMRKVVIYADNLNFMGQLGAWSGETRPVDERTPGPPQVIAHGSGEHEAANVALVKRWIARFNAHDAPGMVPLYAPAAVLDDAHLAGPIATAKAIARWYSDFFPAFPDVAIAEVDAWGAGDYVVATYTIKGTHGGNYPRLDADQTMRQLALEAAAVFRVQGGVIAEQQVFVDGMAIGYQLGALAF